MKKTTDKLLFWQKQAAHLQKLRYGRLGNTLLVGIQNHSAGYRVGWCIPGRFKEQIINIKMMHTISSATPTQAAIAHFYETGRYDLHMRNLRKALHTQSLRYIQAIASHFPANTRISQPKGGYALWIELDKRVDAFELYQAAIAQNISIAPGHIFSTDARFTNFIRISFGIPFDAEVENSFRVLGGLVKDML